MDHRKSGLIGVALIGVLACGSETGTPRKEVAGPGSTVTSAATTSVASADAIASGSTASASTSPTSDAPVASAATGEASSVAPGTSTSAAVASKDPKAPTTSAPTAPTGAPTGAPTASPTQPVDVAGEAKSGPAYSAFLSAKSSYKAGEPASVTAVVSALGDYHINAEYPMKFTLGAAPSGVSFGETVLRGGSKTEKRASISVPFTPSAAGTYTLSGTYSIGVCTASTCVTEKVPLSVAVKVE